MFNISLVSQIFWSYLVEVIFKESSAKGYLYYIGFAVIIIGIFLFNKHPVIQNMEQSKDKNGMEETLLDKQSLNVNDNFSAKSDYTIFSSSEKRLNYYKKTSIAVNKYLVQEHV